MVRAKFVVQSKTQFADGFHVELMPVVGNSEENKSFYKYTPGGKLNLQTINPAAADEFVPGKEVYVDFTPTTPE